MKSFNFAAASMLLGADHVFALGPIVYQGCYSASDGLTFDNTFMYQSKGHCQSECAPSSLVMATANATDCWCGNQLPPSSSKVGDSSCNLPCSGFGEEKCGAADFFSVYLTGLSGSAEGSTSSDAHSPKASPTLSAKPSVITVGGQTVVVTATNSPTATGSSSGGGPSKAGIAAGVVVGIVAIGAAAGGIFLFLRHRKRRQVEEEHRRSLAVNNFINGGKPPTSSAGSSSFADVRLDPVMAQRRMSDGSIADNQDYSRRILKVTNA